MKHYIYKFSFIFVCIYIFNIKCNCNSIYRIVRSKQYVWLQLVYNKSTIIYLKRKMKLYLLVVNCVIRFVLLIMMFARLQTPATTPNFRELSDRYRSG